MKLLVDFSPIYRNAYTLAAALSVLVLVPITNTNLKYSKETIFLLHNELIACLLKLWIIIITIASDVFVIM